MTLYPIAHADKTNRISAASRMGVLLQRLGQHISCEKAFQT